MSKGLGAAQNDMVLTMQRKMKRFFCFTLVYMGRVFIASMNMRGAWAPLPHDECFRVNVTSAQSKTSAYRLAFSPMTEVVGRYKGYFCFENYWQSGKRYAGHDEKEVEKMDAWWRKQKKGKRRYPRGKGLRVTHAEFPRVRGELDYVESRKNVYVPEYYELVRGNAVLTSLAERIASGEDIVVYDFDGPRTKSGDVTCEVVTLELLQEKIDDVSRPFGHGYIIAGILAGIVPSQYV